MSRRSSRRTVSQPAFPQLPPGVQSGLARLVADHAPTVALMLDSHDKDSNNADALCEQCARVMKQQQLSPAVFLARFFQVDLLQQHVALWGKSTKGTAAVLSERIEAAWRKNKPPREEEKGSDGDNDDKGTTTKDDRDRKRTAQDTADETEPSKDAIPKKKKKKASK